MFAYRSRRLPLLLLMSLIVLVLAGCSSSGPSQEQLEDQVWLLESYVSTSGSMTEVIPSSQSNVMFSEGDVSGSGGVNNFNGTYEVDGDDLTVGPLATTLMAGTPELMAQETGFLSALGQVASYEASEDELTMFGVGGEELLFLLAE